MATYLRPGVFINETLQPINDPAVATTNSVAAFVGTSSGGGPLGPTLITSWAQYQALFGNIRKTKDTLGFAVYSYFANGGTNCYISRAINSGSVAASMSFSDLVAGMTLNAPVLQQPTINGSLSSPAIGTATAAGTGGTLAANTYYYVVTATNANGETLKSQEVSATTTGTTSSVALTWTAVPNATGYKVYRGTAAGSENVFYTAAGQATNSFTDTGAANTAGSPPAVNSTAGGSLSANTYYYVVTAINGNGETIASNELSVTVPAATTTTANLSWSAIPGATKYRVYRGTAAGAESVYFLVNAGTSLADTGTAGTAGTPPTSNTATVPTNAEPVLSITANSTGAWASTSLGTSQINVTIAAVADGNFNLTVDVGPNGTTAHEVFTDVSMDPNSPRNVITVINSTTIGSQYVTAASLTTAGQVFGVDYGQPAITNGPVSLAGGSDGTGAPDMVGATQRLGTLTSNLMVNLPGYSVVTDFNTLVTWAQTQGNIFLVLDTPAPAQGEAAATTSSNAQTFVGPTGVTADSHVAVYGPWVYLQDPSTSVPGAVRLVPPGGAVLGQYAASDSLRGVQKVPAGTSTALRKIIQPAVTFAPSDLNTLNQVGVNVIRTVPNVGPCIMGGRTLSKASPDRYINIRRTLMYLEKSIIDLSTFALFEPNTATTWQKVASRLTQFLTQQYQMGVLVGTAANTAFNVVCDKSINTTSSVNSGQLNIEVGVSLGTPAEFIVINIGQIDGGPTTVTETIN